RVWRIALEFNVSHESFSFDCYGSKYLHEPTRDNVSEPPGGGAERPTKKEPPLSAGRHSRTLPQGDGGVRPAVGGSAVGGERDLVVPRPAPQCLALWSPRSRSAISKTLPGRDIVIAAEKIGRVEFGFERHQSGVIDPIGFTHAVLFTLVQRVDVDLAGIKRLHVGENALDPP